MPQFHGQGGPAAGGDAFGVGHSAVPGAPQGYGNGSTQFPGAGIAGQAGAQWNTTFGRLCFKVLHSSEYWTLVYSCFVSVSI